MSEDTAQYVYRVLDERRTRIAALEAENARLRAALERVARYPSPEYPFRAASELREWARRVLAGHEA